MSILNQLNSNQPDTIAAKLKNPFSSTVRNPGILSDDFIGGFVIVEYINGAPQTQTKIVLNGNMMPFQPFPWSGEQRLNKEYYPGNPEPAVHVMGSKEGDLVIHGRFKDKKYAADQIAYGVAYQFALALDAMRKRGNLVKFGMSGKAGNWYRYGFLEKVDFKMNKLSWIDYELSFFVVSEKQPVNNYFAAPEKSAPDMANQNLINAASDFQSSHSVVPTTMPQSLAGVINGYISSVATSVNLVTNFVGGVISTAQDVVSSANRALGLIKNARAQISTFKRQLGGIAYSVSNLSTAADAPTQARSAFSNISYLTQASSATLSMSQWLAAMQSQFEAIAKTVPLARYKVQQGDTLQNIAMKYYGAADNWNVIYDHNKLTSTILVGGQILEIPKV